MDRKTDRWNGSNLNQDSPPKLFKTGCRVPKLLSDIFWGFRGYREKKLDKMTKKELEIQELIWGFFVGT